PLTTLSKPLNSITASKAGRRWLIATALPAYEMYTHKSDDRSSKETAVKHLLIAVFGLSVVALSALADESVPAQWKPVKQSLADLVSAGYTVVAITNEPPTEGLSIE